MDLINFDVTMKDDELETCEFLHMEMEKLRKIAMISGISKSGNQFRLIITEDSSGYLDALKSVPTIKH